jgi:dihydrolipoamide dehydrogenase
MEHYEVCVIGGGPAGYAAAMRAIDYKKKTVLIEKNKVGGTGIYNGALSSKTLWEISEKLYDINETISSKNRENFELPWNDVSQTLKEAIFDRKIQYSAHLKLLREEGSNHLFSFERGSAKMLNNHEIEITHKSGEQKLIRADHIIIATGSRPRTIPSIKVDGEIIMTSDQIEQIKDYPKSLVILGAGVIGCEYATIFSNFGKTKVYMIDKANKILPFEDDDISSLVAKNLKKKGVEIHHDASLERMEVVDGEVEYEIKYSNGKVDILRVEKALLSIGRVPNVENIGMKAANVKMSKRGIHIGDVDTQTNIENIYAVGDASGRIALVNMGELEGRHSIDKIVNPSCEPLSYSNVSTIMFLHPEVATVGLSEKQCTERNLPVKVVKIDYSLIARAIASRKTEGFFKIIVSDDEEMKILGMRAIGAHASSAIQAVALLIKMNESITQLAELVHPHPSYIEGIQECVRMLLNKSVFKSEVFGDGLKCFRIKDQKKVPIQNFVVN